MAGEELIVFWIMAGIFAASSLMFSILARRDGTDNFFSISDIFVCFITTISYVTMALAFATVTANNGQPIYWSRWLFYLGSCSILIADVAIIRGKSSAVELFESMLLIGIVMFTGFLASYITTINRWWYFGLSSVAYLGLMYMLFSATQKQSGMKVMWFVLIFWSLFPLVFILAPTGFGIIPTFIGAILYAILDIITKIIFGLWIRTIPR
jgi:sensory rhodopsin